MSKLLIGREEELALVKKLYEEDRPAFLVIYGRRRVGKTFFVKCALGDCFSFYTTGLYNVGTKEQLIAFHAALNEYAEGGDDLHIAENWFEAFIQLMNIVKKMGAGKKVLFFDELPWMDTPKSGFLTALEYFWNTFASSRGDILLIVCGSAASWMLNKLIFSIGGLYNRVTHRIHMLPFTLRETATFLRARNGAFDNYQILQLYMVMGGIPYYLNDVDVSLSVAQNINNLAYKRGGKLSSDFEGLYRSLFKSEIQHIAIIRALAEKNKGLTRDEIAHLTKLGSGGTLTRILAELEACNFIRKYRSFGKKKYGHLYQLVDFYSLFYLKVIDGVSIDDENLWNTGIGHPSVRAWSGYAFELVGLMHIADIKRGLKIEGVRSESSSWMGVWDGEKAQIDMIIDRRDHVINLCEFKFSLDPYVVDKSYAEVLRRKRRVFKGSTNTTKALYTTLITPYGVKSNSHSLAVIQNELTMDVFF